MAVSSTSPSVPDHIPEGGNGYSHSRRTANLEILRSCPMMGTGISWDEILCIATKELSEAVLALNLPGGSEITRLELSSRCRIL